MFVIELKIAPINLINASSLWIKVLTWIVSLGISEDYKFLFKLRHIQIYKVLISKALFSFDKSNEKTKQLRNPILRFKNSDLGHMSLENDNM